VLEPALEPIVCALAITQGASVMQPPIKPPPPASEPAHVPPWQAMRAQHAWPSMPPIVGRLVITQGANVMRIPIAPPPASEPLPPLPEPDYGDLAFWDGHEFFQPSSDWRLPAHIARAARSHD